MRGTKLFLKNSLALLLALVMLLWSLMMGGAGIALLCVAALIPRHQRKKKDP